MLDMLHVLSKRVMSKNFMHVPEDTRTTQTNPMSPTLLALNHPCLSVMTVFTYSLCIAMTSSCTSSLAHTGCYRLGRKPCTCSLS